MQKATLSETLLTPMNNWKIATTNARGMNNPEKQQDIIKWHQENQHTISIITETRLKPLTAQYLKKYHPEILQLHSTDPNNPNGSGVAIIINRTLAPHIHQISETAGRCITIHLKFAGKITLTITGIYNQANKNKNTGHSITKHLQHHHQHSTHSIIGGDFNESITKPRILLKWIKKMKYVNLAKIFKQTQTPTWSNGMTHSTIDFIWTSHNLAIHSNQFIINSTNHFFNSDHQAISTKIDFTSISRQIHPKLKRKRRKIFDLSNITPDKWSQWQSAITEQITQHPNQH
jgi:Endonuclease-reverse transcriptase